MANIKRTLPGQPTERKRADRNLSLYPPTPAGDQAFLRDVRQAKLAIQDRAGVPPPPTSAPGAPQFLAYTDQGWSGADMKYIENDQLRVGFRRSVGACICDIQIKALGTRNFVNDPDANDHPGVKDKGRQIQFLSDYWTLANRYQVTPTKNTGDFGYDTGGNCVQGGDKHPYLNPSLILSSAIVDVPGRGQVFCARIRPKWWAVPNEDSHVVGDIEVWLVGNAIAYLVRHQIEARPAGQSQPIYQARKQENPCVYGIGNLTNYKAKIGGQIVSRFPEGWVEPQERFSEVVTTDACWIGVYEGDGPGLTLYSPRQNQFDTGVFNHLYGDSNGGGSSYINGATNRNYDNPGLYYDEGYIIAGTYNEAMSRIALLPPPDQAFDFDFGVTNDWGNLDCRVIRENPQSVSVYIGDAKTDNNVTSTKGNFMSPHRAWRADEFQTIEFEMAVTGVQQLQLKWTRPGETNTSQFFKTISLAGLPVDGQYHTYRFSTADPNWQGIITSVGLQGVTGGVTANAGKLQVRRVRKV